jgi:hypothetical protein
VWRETSAGQEKRGEDMRRPEGTWSALNSHGARTAVEIRDQLFALLASPMCIGYWTSPSAFMVSCTFGLAPIRAMNALMLGHFARSILWMLVQLITVNR